MPAPKVCVGLVAATCAAVFSVTACQPAADTVAANKPLAGSVGSSSHHHRDHHGVAAHHRVHVHRKSHATRRGDVLINGGRVVLPNPRLTPGAVNAAVTQQTIRSTICRTGYTSTIRPSSSYTTSLKVQQLGSGYAFHGDRSTHDYEEDHLIALELGGAPSNPRNLWPEPYADSAGARTKDLVENELHDLVCAGQVSLRAAQHAIATNWWRAYQRYGGRGVPDVYVGAYGGAKQSAAGTSTSTSTSGGATARCVDGTLSYSAHRSGTCSHHGGVAQWINPPPS